MSLKPTLRSRISKAERKRKLARLNRLLRVQERVWTADLKRLFAKTTTRVASSFASSRNSTFVEGRARLERELGALFLRRYLATAFVFGEEIVNTAKSAGGELRYKDFAGLFENAVRLWVIRFGLLKVSTIAATYFEGVTDVIRQAGDDGLGQEVTARRIREVVGVGYQQWKAARVARTEAHTAASMGMEEAVRSTDLDFDREWLAAEDSRTRPSHADADGQLVSGDQPFIVGGSSLMYPGDPAGPAREIINCRCVLAYHPRV